MPKPSSEPILWFQVLTSLSIVAFTLFLLRLALFWFNILPTFGIEITNYIVFQWVLTFLLDSLGLFLGRFLTEKAKKRVSLPQYMKGLALILILILSYQIYSIVFHSWAGLAYQFLVNQSSLPLGPFQPR